MPYFLHHHFDPDFDHTRLTPKEDGSGQVDHYNLGYVQNVIRDQVLAEIREVDAVEAADLDPRFLVSDPAPPSGRGTRVNPDDPRQLLAERNGYVLYEDGLICVREVLNIRRNVDFHTGNIVFVGDMVVHGRVRSSFSIQARNILVKDNIQDSQVKAQFMLKAEAGVLGGPTAEIQAGKSIQAPFISNCRVLAGESLLVEGALMHSYCYVRKQISVKGRLQGGCVYCNGLLAVHEQIGGGGNTITSVVMGLDPFLMLQAENLEEKIQDAHQRLTEMRATLKNHPETANDFKQEYQSTQTLLQKLLARRKALDAKLAASKHPEQCSLIVPGTVKPGLEISIGSAYLAVDEQMEDVRFVRKDDEILTVSPALK